MGGIGNGRVALHGLCDSPNTRLSDAKKQNPLDASEVAPEHVEPHARGRQCTYTGVPSLLDNSAGVYPIGGMPTASTSFS